MKTELKIKDNIATISVNRPETLNALDCSIIEEINTHVRTIQADNQVRVLIFYSEKSFAAGADISEMVKCTSEDTRKFPYSPTYNMIEALPIPTISAIEGFALGGGLELALATDIRFAERRAKLGFPEVNLGVFPGAGGSIRLPRLIGPSKAKELIFSGAVISAQQAQDYGFVNRVVEDGQVLAEAEAFAAQLLTKAPLALQAAKEVIDFGMGEPDTSKAIQAEGETWSRLFDTEDQKEGMAAFLEKRPAKFSGK